MKHLLIPSMPFTSGKWGSKVGTTSVNVISTDIPIFLYKMNEVSFVYENVDLPPFTWGGENFSKFERGLGLPINFDDFHIC